MGHYSLDCDNGILNYCGDGWRSIKVTPQEIKNIKRHNYSIFYIMSLWNDGRKEY